MKTWYLLGLTLSLASFAVGSVLAATVGSPTMTGFSITGVGEKSPQEGADYPEFVVKGADNYSYLIFAGAYGSDDWAACIDDVCTI